MSNRKQSGNGGTGFAVLVFIAVVWLLRWAILAGMVVAGVVWLTRRILAQRAEVRAAEVARVDALRQRAERENAMVLRGDPHGFYGQYPLPDPTLIPRWYKTGRGPGGASRIH